MIYNKFKDLKISALGMGNMRLPTKGDAAQIDEEKAFEIIDYAYNNGVNYFDTAYVYHGGQSERFIGKALSRYPRESWYLADKFLSSAMKPGQSISDYFEEQLERCGVDYFDFYLIHNVSDQNISSYLELNEEQGMMAYFDSQKKAGRIKHLGFSSHSTPENLEKFLDIYDFEFVQLQLNYVDWTLQDAKRKHEILTNRGIPVIVMEPVRGGALAGFDSKYESLLKELRADESIAAWAFRFIQTLPNILVTLSGMSTMQQVVDNVKTFENECPLNKKEIEVLNEITSTLLNQIPCTGCKYCVDDCPTGLNIPFFFSEYNEYLFSKFNMSDIKNLPENKRPSACISCGVCSKACPQGIDIPAVIKELDQIVSK